MIPLAATDGFRVMRFGDTSNFQHRFDGNGDSWIGREKGTLIVGPDAAVEGTVSGIQSVYMRNAGGTNRNTVTVSSTSYVAGGSELCDCTFIAPPSGRILIIYYFIVEPGTASERVFGTAEVREDNASGAVVDAASDNNAVHKDGTSRGTIMGFHSVSSLTPGAQYYARTMQRTKDGSTSNVNARRINVLPSF